ncbi:MAG: spore cortex biosynthesis protein YabQ [Oscillospiraceae bacterium]|nr:spore cortex biosynthesis protein YabQ [Oscillospiraceae bacterium]
MELPVITQLRELLYALAVGAGLGLCYDLLRPLRRGRWTTGLTDLIYCLLTLATLLGFALYAGRGRLRLFAELAILCGLGAYFWAWSLPLRQLLRLLTKPLRILAVGCRRIRKKILKNCKKMIAFAGKYAKINNSQFIGKLHDRKGGLPVAVQEIIPADEAVDSRRGGLCTDHTGKSPGFHQRGKKGIQRRRPPAHGQGAGKGPAPAGSGGLRFRQKREKAGPPVPRHG